MKFKALHFKPVVLSGLIILSVFNLKSQTLSWAKKISGTSMNLGASCVVDASGNLYTTGFYSGTVDFDPGPGIFNLTATALSDIFISKLDPAGNLVWAKGMDGSSTSRGMAITLDAQGNVYTTGFFQGTVDFDPGVGVSNLISVGGTDVFISKLDGNGNFVWAKQMGTPQADQGNAIAVDALGNLYIAGSYSGSGDFDPGAGTFNLFNSGVLDIFLCKLDASGNFDWAKNMSGNSIESAFGIAIDSQNNILITGYFSTGTGVDFNPGPSSAVLMSAGGNDIFVAKYTPSGSYVWAKRMGGTATSDIGYGLVVDNFDNVYTVGSFESTADFDPDAGVYNLTAGGLTDGFVSKLDDSGNFVWARRLAATGANFCKSIATDLLGSIYIAGNFEGTIDLDPGTPVANVLSNGARDFALCKLDTAGNYQWGRTFGGIYDDLISCVTVDKSGDVYATGNFMDIVDFDPNAGVFNMTSSAIDTYNFKLCQPPNNPSIAGLKDVCVNVPASYTVDNAFANMSFTWSIPNGWSGSSNTSTITIAPTGLGGTFTVSASNNCGISNSQTLNVVIHKPTVTITANRLTVCIGESAILSANGANTYTWNTASTGWQTAVSPSIMTTYNVFGSDVYNCKDTASITIDVSECVGIHETKNEKQILNLYPNPAGNNLSIWLTGTEDTFFGSITVYNDLGVLVKEKKDVNFKNETMVVETSDLPNGIYVLKLNNNNYQNISKTFVVNR